MLKIQVNGDTIMTLKIPTLWGSKDKQIILLLENSALTGLQGEYERTEDGNITQKRIKESWGRLSGRDATYKYIA